ncbi:MAG TPA: hypothetical protein VGF80_14790, partial [Galbitalea sp.]
MDWSHHGLGLKAFNEFLYGSYTRTIKNEAWYFRPAVSFNTIGSAFSGRIVRYASAFDVRGSCVFPQDVARVVVLMNTPRVTSVLESLNPGINFQVGDVNRLPLFRTPDAAGLVSVLERAFSAHESARESSVEFRQPGPSPWRYAQAWAQLAVERPEQA